MIQSLALILFQSRFLQRLTLNNPDYYTLVQPALLGIGTARALAKTFQLVLDGSILNASTLARISVPYVHRQDVITAAEFARGYGFTYLPFVHNQVGKRKKPHSE